MIAGDRAGGVANGRSKDAVVSGARQVCERQRHRGRRIWLKTALIVAFFGCSGSGANPVTPAPTSISIFFWEDPNLTIVGTITGSDGSTQTRNAVVAPNQPAKPAGVPAGYQYHVITNVEVSEGVSYYMSVNRGDDLNGAWDYNWDHGSHSEHHVQLGTPPFGN
jgi:hypothetical protein